MISACFKPRFYFAKHTKIKMLLFDTRLTWHQLDSILQTGFGQFQLWLTAVEWTGRSETELLLFFSACFVGLFSFVCLFNLCFTQLPLICCLYLGYLWLVLIEKIRQAICEVWKLVLVCSWSHLNTLWWSVSLFDQPGLVTNSSHVCGYQNMIFSSL